jgi:hypothetical protein
MELAIKSIFQTSFEATLSQISKFLEVLILVSDALLDPTMPFRSNLRRHKINISDLINGHTKATPHFIT